MNSSGLVPLNGTEYLIGYGGVLSEILLQRSGARVVVLEITNRSILLFKNQSTGDFGIDANGNFLYTTPNCSQSFVISVAAASGVSPIKKRSSSSEVPPTRSDINVDTTIFNYDDQLNTCPINPVLICNDQNKAHGGLPDYYSLDIIAQAQYFGTCPFPEGPAYIDCIEALKNSESLYFILTSLSEANEILLLEESDEFCILLVSTLAAAIAIPEGPLVILTLLAIAESPFAAAAYPSCLVAAFYLKELFQDDVIEPLAEFSPEKLCQAIGYGDPGNIYEIAVTDSELPSPTIFVITVTGVNPPDIITDVQIDYFVSACTMTSTGSSSTTPSTTPGICTEFIPLGGSCNPVNNYCCADGYFCIVSTFEPPYCGNQL